MKKLVPGALIFVLLGSCFFSTPSEQTMNKELEAFLKNNYNTISINYSEFEIANSSSFDDLQEGYRLNSESGESFIGTGSGDWKEEWYVVGALEGDPVFVDITENSVFTAMHGSGSWDPEKICNTLADFRILLDGLKMLGKGRENPVSFENNPLSKKELVAYMSSISKTKANESFWSQFTE